MAIAAADVEPGAIGHERGGLTCYRQGRFEPQKVNETGVPGLIAPQVMNLMRMARGMGLGSSDSCSVIRVYETALDTEVRA